MQKWYQIFHKNTGLSLYAWLLFFILPFYFIFRSSSTYEVISGIVMILLFFICYVLSFVTKGWPVYLWTSIQIIISVTMTIIFGYVYFALFLAFFIGNIQHRVGFFILYSILLAGTLFTINYGFITRNPILITQLPFVLLSLIGVILLPVINYNKNNREKLEDQLEDAHKKLSELAKLEERQRIARDLHDTLGQKLSLIGLKSDLASKLVNKYPEKAEAEINDIRTTARSALNEVRELVTKMRGTRLEDELFRIKQILNAAQIDFTLEGNLELSNISLLNENVLSMCMKEAVTNIVKHSQATSCSITIESTQSDLSIKIQDNGIGITKATHRDTHYVMGNGLMGMRERLEFVNGSLDVYSDQGTTIVLKVPNMFQQSEKELGT